MLHKRSLRFRNVYSSDFGSNTLFLRCCVDRCQWIVTEGGSLRWAGTREVLKHPIKAKSEKFQCLLIWWGDKRQERMFQVSEGLGVGGENEPSSVRSYLFFHSALGFAQPTSAAPTPVRLAPTGPVQAPSPPRLMGGPPHPPRKATTQRCHCQQRRPALK